MNELQIFNNPRFGEIRWTKYNNKDYAVANDIAKALGYSDCPKAVRTHCKGVAEMSIPSNGGMQVMKVIPEGDIYRLIVKSQLPQAEKFEHWVFDEVLPSIRENGRYDGLSTELKSILILDKKTQVIENRVLNLENTMTIDYSQQAELNILAKRRVLEALGGKDTPAYKELNKKAFSSIWKDFKRALDVNSYRNTAVKHFEAAKRFIESWEPQRDLELMIKGANSQLRIIEL